VDAERKKKLAVRTVLVTYQAALRHARARDRARLRSRALEMLDDTAVRIEPDADPELRRMLDHARRTISAR